MEVLESHRVPTRFLLRHFLSLSRCIGEFDLFFLFFFRLMLLREERGRGDFLRFTDLNSPSLLLSLNSLLINQMTDRAASTVRSPVSSSFGKLYPNFFFLSSEFGIFNVL
jgi:hypothetical protein